MPKYSGRERLIFGVTLTLLMLLAADRLLVAPVVVAWHDLDQAVAEKHRQLDHDKQLLAESKDIRSAYAAFSVSRRMEREPNRMGGTTRMLREIEALARRSGVKISDLKPEPVVGRSTQSPTVVVRVNSGWTSLVRFVYELQRSSQLLQIEKASIQRKGDDEMSLTGQLVVVTRAEDAS